MKLIYAKDKYIADESLAIRTYVDEGFGLEPYGYVSVCLYEYGYVPEEGHIFMPTYKMSEDYTNQVIDDIVDRIVTEVPIGLGTGLYVKLKPDWEEKVQMTEMF